MSEILTNGDMENDFNGHTILYWNTLREYSKEGQKIVAVQNPKGDVLFFDLTRNIDGIMENCKLDVHSIMRRYDKGHYSGDFIIQDNYCIQRDMLCGDKKMKALFDEKTFDEDKEYKIPINNIDFIELDPDMQNYEVAMSTGEPTRKYRGTKCIVIRGDFVLIR